MVTKILHGLDGSAGSLRALDAAVDLARQYGAELHTISVEEVPHYAGAVGEVVEEQRLAHERFHTAIEEARSRAMAAGVTLHAHAVVGHEVKTIVEFIAEDGFDLLVIGFHGHSAIYDKVMGSTSLSLVRLAACSVWVVK